MTVPPPGSGDETILLVEDEALVRALIEKILAGRGYTVLSAASPDEALRLSREHEVDAVVTDVAMPSMNGPALVDELRRHQPQLRALFISGYTSDTVLELGVKETEVAFVQKPFTAEALASRLRHLLDA
jgi:two-component system cell cycle sensor histidine kinase/response regulator CckA